MRYHNSSDHPIRAAVSPTPTKLTSDQEQIAAEIAHLLRRLLLRGHSGPPRQIVLNRVWHEIDTLSRALPIAKSFFNRKKNKPRAEKIIDLIDTLKQLLKTAPEGLAASFFLDEDSFYKQLNRIQNGHRYSLIGPDFGLHHRFDLAGQWCAQSAATLIKELAPTAKITSTDRNSLFRRVAGLLKDAVTGKDLKAAGEVDIERACRIVKSGNRELKQREREILLQLEIYKADLNARRGKHNPRQRS
jgi:hypothetical protein